MIETMRYYHLHELSKDSVNMIRHFGEEDGKLYEEIYERKNKSNNIKMRILFSLLCMGKINGFFCDTNEFPDKSFQRIVWHRSSRDDVLVQKTNLSYYKNGEIIPNYHEEISNLDDFYRCNYPCNNIICVY